MQIHKILEEYWGFDTFRSLQEDIITSVMEGKDTLALLPTGGGKSVCFQVPAMAMEGICLVVSPLIALMKDQVEHLKNKGIPALSIYAGMSFWEVKKTLENAAHGNYKFLYVSPERLESNIFLEYLPALPINLLAVDEAHCISQWGYDFRPPYLRIAALREQLEGVPILALTASATKEVQDDICEKLQFNKGYQRFQKSFERPALSYSAFNAGAKQVKLVEILNKVSGTSIVYCKSRKRTKEVADLLKMHSIQADYYHAGLTNETRTAKQQSWVRNETRVIVCTNAFGMGIDKSNVRSVIHYDVPDALENYYQEAGRAGRDEKIAYAVLLYNEHELTDLEKQSAIRFPSEDEVRKVYRSLVNYFQLPAGSGEGVYYDFDISDFVKKFKLDIYTANYSLKILEQEEVLTYNEQVFLPATLVFTVERDALQQFESVHPELEPIIKGLLRSYEGIFDYPAAIYENQLAKFIKIALPGLKAGIIALHQAGIVAYQPQKEKPQVQFLQNRVIAGDFTINREALAKRKAAFEKRVKAMVSYVRTTTTCRSKQIGNYFNDLLIKPCGICDNCINETDIVISTDEFAQIRKVIEDAVKDKPVIIAALLELFPGISKERIWKVLNYLQTENTLIVSREGYISMK